MTTQLLWPYCQFRYSLPRVTCYDDFPVWYCLLSLLIMLEIIFCIISFFTNIYVLLITNNTILVVAVFLYRLLFLTLRATYYLLHCFALLLARAVWKLLLSTSVFLTTLSNKWLVNILFKLYQLLLQFLNMLCFAMFLSPLLFRDLVLHTF